MILRLSSTRGPRADRFTATDFLRGHGWKKWMMTAIRYLRTRPANGASALRTWKIPDPFVRFLPMADSSGFWDLLILQEFHGPKPICFMARRRAPKELQSRHT